MTPQEWQQVEDKMKSVFVSVKLEVDGYNISLAKELYGDAFRYMSFR